MDNDDDLIDPVLVERFANGNGTILSGPAFLPARVCRYGEN